MRSYYIIYREEAEINYLLLLLLHKIAQVDKKTRLYNTIEYSSLEALAASMNEAYEEATKSKEAAVSKATLSRFLKEYGNSLYFKHDRQKKHIVLLNDMKNATTKKKEKFIVLTDKEINFLLLEKQQLLIRYYLFIKYNCGYSGKNYTDFTASQFLEASNYSSTSGKNKALLSSYNALLTSNGLIRISKFRLDGKERNGYTII